MDVVSFLLVIAAIAVFYLVCQKFNLTPNKSGG